METVHLITGIAVLAGNLVAGTWGGIAWVQNRPAVGFWYALRCAQVAVVVQVIVGAILLLLNRQAPDELHYLYGVLPLAVSLLAESVRATAAGRELEGLDFDSLPASRQRTIAMAIVRRETGIMAVSALVITFLALRAAGTSTFF